MRESGLGKESQSGEYAAGSIAGDWSGIFTMENIMNEHIGYESAGF